jgi:hypothetical protein
VKNGGRGGRLSLPEGLSVAALSRRAGIRYSRCYRIVRQGWPGRRLERTRLARALGDELRLRRSSDPGFLSAIRRVAAPFLAGRLRATR